MRRIFIAAIGILIILSLGTVGSVLLDTACDNVQSAVEKSISFAKREDYKAAAEEIEKAAEEWDKKESLLSLYVNHGYLYEVRVRMVGLSEMANTDAKEEFLYSAEQTLAALKYVRSDK